MMSIFIIAAKRTAIGKFGGALVDASPTELGVTVLRSAIDSTGKAEQIKSRVSEVILGNVLGAGHGMNIARQVCLKSGLPVSVPSYVVNKVCGSGLKSVMLGCQSIQSGDGELVVAGGTESMSQAGFISMGARWGAKLGHAELRDIILQDGLTDVFNSCHMGITAENLAVKYSISRKDQDDFALESQKRAAAAIAAGHFKDEIAAFPLMKKGKQIGEFNTDEHYRADTTAESLASLKPAFKSDGTVTAGNASGINDGAAVCLLASEKAVKELGVTPLARVIGWSNAGVEPEFMGMGPVGAVQNLVKKTGINLSQVDIFEANEAFAAQALSVSRALELDPSKVNISGGAIALGHPIGASGARVLVTLTHALKRTSKKYGIATLCVGGGQGVAMMIERV